MARELYRYLDHVSNSMVMWMYFGTEQWDADLFVFLMERHLILQFHD